MDNQETDKHWRICFKNSHYLASVDITEPMVFTIASAEQEKDQNKRTKEDFLVIYFEEKFLREDELLKPMVVNVTNSKAISKVAGSHFYNRWAGVKITLFCQENIRLKGEVTQGIRVSDIPPRSQQKPTLQQGTKAWDNAIAAFKRDRNLDKVLARMIITPADQEALKNV